MLCSQQIYKQQPGNCFDLVSIKYSIAESGLCKILLISVRPIVLVKVTCCVCGVVNRLLELHRTDCSTGSNQKLSPAAPSPSDHRITEWLGLEESLEIALFQPCCQGQGHLPLGQDAPSPSQPGLEQCQGRDSHSFCGQRGPGAQQPQRQNFLHICSLRPPCDTGKPLGLALSLQALAKSPCAGVCWARAGTERLQEGVPGEGLAEPWGRECHHEGSKRGLARPAGREGTGRAPRPCQLELELWIAGSTEPWAPTALHPSRLRQLPRHSRLGTRGHPGATRRGTLLWGQARPQQGAPMGLCPGRERLCPGTGRWQQGQKCQAQ